MFPRQHYGVDFYFYGVNGGEILVAVDLFTRETILIYLRNRNQDNVAKALIKNIIFQRGVPSSIISDLRTDNFVKRLLFWNFGPTSMVFAFGSKSLEQPLSL